MADLDLQRVTDEVICIRRRSYQTCSYLVQGRDGIVLIDASMRSDAKDVAAALKLVKSEFTAIRAILVTHWHNDHAAGAGKAQQLSGAPVYYHEAEAPYLNSSNSGTSLAARVSTFVPEWGPLVLLKGLLREGPPRNVRATRFVSDGDEPVGGFEVVHTPGHTPGHLSYYYRPQRILFSGDAVAVVRGKVRFMARAVTPDLPSARASMLRCLSSEAEIVCPGHRHPVTGVQPQFLELKKRIEKEPGWPILG